MRAVSDYSEGSDKQNCEQEGHDILEHHNVNAFSAEFVTVESHFAYQQMWFGDPAYEDTGANGNKRHEQVVADVIEYVEDLCCDPIGQCIFKV